MAVVLLLRTQMKIANPAVDLEKAEAILVLAPVMEVHILLMTFQIRYRQ